MPGLRPLGEKNGVVSDVLYPGDLLLLGETIATLTTVGAGAIPASAIVQAGLYRTGPVGGYTDTMDTAANVLAALAGNSPAADVVPGTSWRWRYWNSVAQAETMAWGAGWLQATPDPGASDSVAASLWRDYLFTVLCSQPVTALQAIVTSGSKVVTFVLPSGRVSLSIGPNTPQNNIQVGASVTGTGLVGGQTVASLTMGQGGITGVVLSANASVSSLNGTAVTFGPTLQYASLGSGTL
jgi:hypothetical protein